MRPPLPPRSSSRAVSARRLEGPLARLTGGLLAGTLILAGATGVEAQAAHPGHDGAGSYADHLDRAIKALAPDEIEGLRSGEGMGFALAAELNGVPGPRHVLELAEELGLDAGQVEVVQAIRHRMTGAARRLGERIVEAEMHLDAAFAQGHATADLVVDLTGRIGQWRGELRGVHLLAHLETAEVLSGEQIRAYQRLRGYNRS